VIPIALNLPSGLGIEDGQTKLHGIFSRWHDLHGAMPVPRDNVLRPEDMVLCTMMNSRMSGKTAVLIREHREAIKNVLQPVFGRALAHDIQRRLIGGDQ
jgi:hypothetical protein